MAARLDQRGAPLLLATVTNVLRRDDRHLSVYFDVVEPAATVLAPPDRVAMEVLAEAFPQQNQPTQMPNRGIIKVRDSLWVVADFYPQKANAKNGIAMSEYKDALMPSIAGIMANMRSEFFSTGDGS